MICMQHTLQLFGKSSKIICNCDHYPLILLLTHSSLSLSLAHSAIGSATHSLTQPLAHDGHAWCRYVVPRQVVWDLTVGHAENHGKVRQGQRHSKEKGKSSPTFVMALMAHKLLL